jgi:ATP-dependent DNA helicase RecG
MNPSELKRLLADGESDTVEFKESLQEEALHTVGAFANTRGGTILLGVNDSGVPVGTTVGKSTLREITDRIASCTDPRVVPDVQAVTLKGRTVIAIHVPEYPIKPVAVRGRCYRRVGDSNRLMSPHAVAEMHNASTGTSWDARALPNKAIKDLNLARVRRYMTLATTVGRRSFTGAKPREVIQKLELVLDGHPTWASILLFGKRPQSPLTQATVHCGRFRTETDIVDDRLIEGSIVDQIEETMDFLKKHINVRFVITGKPQRDQIWDYPLQALREAVVNAICHRDYGDNADIQIKVFDDHIRIWNPGFLPYGVTIEDLYRRTHASKPRNKLIAQVFYDLEIIERYGSGIQRMLDACRAAQIPEPTFEESTGGFLITFRKAVGQVPRQVTTPVTAPVGAPVTAPVRRLLSLLSSRGAASNAEILQAFGLKSRRRMREAYITPALHAALIERTIPGKPQSRLQRYRLAEKGRAWLAGEESEKGEQA